MSLKIRAMDLCHAIEQLPASEQQTKVSLMASELRRDIELSDRSDDFIDPELAYLQKLWDLISPSNNVVVLNNIAMRIALLLARK